jgi:transcriptional regulator with XRE-family HTH domain
MLTTRGLRALRGALAGTLQARDHQGVAHDTDQVIAANLRALRARQGIRQIDLATLTGLSRPTIAALEKGSRRVTVADAIALCSALGVGVGALLQGDQDALRALGLDQTDEQAAQVWADALGDEGLDALAAGLRDARLPVSAAGRAVAVLRAAGRL